MAYSTGTNRTRPRGQPQGGAGQQLADRAVALAGQSLWAEAAAANRALLEIHPNNTSALNRLGKCLTELGQYEEAAAAYERALQLDTLNEIARKNLARLSLLAQGEGEAAPVPGAVAPEVFIADPGTSTITTLAGAADLEALAASSPGAHLELHAIGGALVVRDQRGRLLGSVEPRLAQRLLALMEGGNRYTAALASSTDSPARVILRETYRHPSQANKVSFPARPDPEAVRAYTRGTLLRPADEGWDDEDAEAEEGDSPATREGADYPEAEGDDGEPRDPFAGEGPVVVDTVDRDDVR